MTNKTAAIKTKQMLVTPQMAAKWLERNHPENRPISKLHVEKLVDEIHGGRWMPTHQGIAFNCDGTLHDGQHRLTAIVKSNVAVVLNVSSGLPVESMTVIDSVQKTRTIADAACIVHGMDRGSGTKDAVAAATWVYHGVAPFNRARTRSEQLDFFMKHADAIRWALDKLGRQRAPVVGAVARAYYGCKKRNQLTSLARFCEVYRSGERGSGPEHEDNIIKLRLWIASHPGGGWSACSSTYKKTAAAILAHLDGRKLSQIREVDKEPFQLDDGALDGEGEHRPADGEVRRDVVDFVRGYGEPVALSDIAEYLEISRERVLPQVKALVSSGALARDERPGHYVIGRP